jgi:hypothetical protein
MEKYLRSIWFYLGIFTTLYIFLGFMGYPGVVDIYTSQGPLMGHLAGFVGLFTPLGFGGFRVFGEIGIIFFWLFFQSLGIFIIYFMNRTILNKNFYMSGLGIRVTIILLILFFSSVVSSLGLSLGIFSTGVYNHIGF